MITIIQPCIPKYRKALYNKLSKLTAGSLCVYASSQDYSGLESDCNGLDCGYSLSLNEKSYGPIMWQHGVFSSKIISSEVLVVTGNPRYLSNYILLLIFKFKRKPILWWGQGWSANTSNASYLVRKIIMCLFDGVILYTEKEYERIISERIRPKRCAYLNNGIDVDEVDLVHKANDSFLLNSSTSLNLIFIGRLTEKSGIDFIIESLKLVGFNVRLVVVGSGEKLPDARSIDLPNNIEVEFAGALFAEEQIAPYMSSSDYFIYGGSVGLSLIHAMAYGVPSIVHSDLTQHMPEIAAFEEGVTGICFDKGSSESLALALSKAKKLKEDGGLDDLRRRCYSLVRDKFNVGAMAENFNEFIRQYK